MPPDNQTGGTWPTQRSECAPAGNARGEDTRRRVLNAALDLFGSLGFEATSTRMLAERAGVNLPAIQYYFGSKEGLYRAVIQQIVDRIEADAGPVGARIVEALAGEPAGRS